VLRVEREPTEDHVRHIAIVDFVDLHGDASPIVPDLDLVPFWVQLNLDHILCPVILVVVCRIDQNLVYNSQ